MGFTTAATPPPFPAYFSISGSGNALELQRVAAHLQFYFDAAMNGERLRGGDQCRIGQAGRGIGADIRDSGTEECPIGRIFVVEKIVDETVNGQTS
jgi:hypothetical protein